MKLSRFRKKIAIGLLMPTLFNLLLPLTGHALTSGPTQPEVAAFQPAGVSDMVDLFTGDFKYNIPLLDIDGYPINLNYASGTGMDDEASWVGLGWNVNVGAINRQVRGVPDDMAGDNIVANNWTKPKVTVGGRVRVKGEIFQIGKLIKGSGSLGLGIFNDNYTGIGADVSANVGVSFGNINETPFTAGLGLGINSSTASGVDISPSANLGISRNINDEKVEHAGLSASLGYNSRSGLKSLTLGSSFDVGKLEKYKDKDGKDQVREKGEKSGFEISGSFISFNTEPVMPKIQVPYKGRYGSFSLDVGGTWNGFFAGPGATGYMNVREVASTQMTNPSYGFMYAELGKSQKTATMDFIRDGENPIIPELPNLAVPVPTPDLFSFTSQEGSGQFRLYRGGSGAFFDNEVKDDNSSTTIGADLGFGPNWGLAHGGITWYKQNSSNTTRKWTSNNNYIGKGDFQDASYANPSAQHMYFKMVGERTLEDANMTSQLQDIQPLAVNISGKTANAQFSNNVNLTNPLKKMNRSINTTTVSYLTGEEAAAGGLDKMIKTYAFNDASTFQAPTTYQTQTASLSESRYFDNTTGYRRRHHISEITVTKTSGQRMVYGIPVYNIKQTEYSFAIGAKGSEYSMLPNTAGVKGTDNTFPNTNNLVSVAYTNPGTSTAAINYKKGIDNYYHDQTQPAYASSFLLTAILSPDYADRLGDGISDDDAGTAIKFNYSKLSTPYKWRSPFAGATLNRSLLADKDDDKGSIVYGEKEVYYVQTIESKTKIAYFITQNRNDAMGVTDFTGTSMDTSNPLKCLKEIRLYSKADMSKPIKVVKFEYSYELCRGIPNNTDNANGLNSNPALGGKLTLKKVWFQYGNSPKGANFPYQFTYNNSVNGQTINYGDMLTDRWGVYKSPDANLGLMKNDEFPYTAQDLQGNNSSIKATEDQNAALWHLASVQLPTGGNINVNYESGDYAYVQDKRAMAMSGIAGLIDQSGNDISSSSETALRDAHGIKVQIPNTTVTGDPTAWFKNNYLNGADYIYTKFSVKISTAYSNSGGPDYDYDFIPCYSKVQSVSVSGGYAKIIFENRADGGVTANPIIFSAWQKIKDEYPRYAYSGFDRRTKDGDLVSAVSDAVSAVLSAIGNLSELTENFYHKANRKSFAGNIQLEKCFAKLVKQDGHKLGGGVRVKKIMISDTWDTMSGNNGAQPASYGQAYDYTTVENGVTISSGVAAYEPSIGNDENALKQPVPYVEKFKGAIDDFFDLEQPFGESFYPAPSVGYSRVTVTDLDKNHNPDPTLRTGYTVNEFYTAKEFPVQATALPIIPIHNKPVNKFSFLGATSIDELTMSQGYSFVLNDMHGKEKKATTYNQSGAEISSTEYQYRIDTIGADKFQLNNTVDIVNADGTMSNSKIIGRDIDFFTDFREFESKNSGISLQAGYDMVGLGWFSFPFFVKPSYDDSDYKLFRSACAVKVSQYYGIVKKVIKRQNGSVIATEDLAYDGVTGNPVVTRTQTEFNNPQRNDTNNSIYTTNLPAYWVYKGMGAAYQNANMLLKNFTTDANGVINSAYWNYLKAGDELVNIAGVTKYWVIEDQATSPSTESSPTKKLIDIKGGYVDLSAGTGITVKLSRSGYRNILDASTEHIVSLNNPIVNNKLQIASNADQTSLKVINASMTAFNESWGMDQSGQPQDYTAIPNGAASTYQSVSVGGVHFIAAVNYFPNSCFFPCNDNQTDEVSFGKAGLYGAAIWPTTASGQLSNPQVTINHTIYAPYTGWYYFVYSGAGSYQYTIDNSTTLQRPTNTYYGVSEVQLTAGSHQISLVEPNSGSGLQYITLMVFGSTTPTSSTDGFIDRSQLVFSTGNLANLNDIHTYDYRYHINPYVRGFLGNWREIASNVFQQSRHYNTDPSVKGVDVRNAGYINNFSSYWYYDVIPSTVPVNTVTFGQAVPLSSRGSSGVYSFGGDIPGAQDQVLTSGSLVSRMQGALDRSGIWPVPVTTQQLGHQVTAVGTFTSGAGEYYFGYSGDDNFVYSIDGTTLPQRPNTLWCWYPMTLTAGTHHLTLQATNNNSSFPGAIGMEIYTSADGSGTPVFSTTSLIGIPAPPPQYAWQTDNLGNRARWVTANTITGYDRYGQQIENKDALGRFSAAAFGFNGELPIAVASNAMSREIYNTAFEDTRFSPGTGFNTLRSNEFKVTNTNSISSAVVTTESHSGRYSVALPTNGLTLTTKAHSQLLSTNNLLSINQYGEYNTKTTSADAGLYPNGFEPQPGKKYIIDVWVKDGHPSDKNVYLQLNAGIPPTIPVDDQYSPTSVPQITLTCKALVEDWKLLEGTIDLTSIPAGSAYAISLTPGSGSSSQIYIDDIRIHPVDAQMKSYVYDDRNMRLMAELDENGFATFYEYDDEGLLIRVKKETERGVMTLKESRSSYKRQP
ncbi:hypothetical protein [Mucilaginibacter sp. BT774]|uniref:hypothetical protein n=1 Tax=Mucilaginibacter sp. BT774 TaxID=3062276 RepID=UPI0026744AA0|nr:hypothetical protein [Mucilaginibacter sp. BT774]MDO3628864.1 hypothetical protein [Mucilaginibacter sp. BT774]